MTDPDPWREYVRSLFAPETDDDTPRAPATPRPTETTDDMREYVRALFTTED